MDTSNDCLNPLWSLVHRVQGSILAPESKRTFVKLIRHDRTVLGVPLFPLTTRSTRYCTRITRIWVDGVGDPLLSPIHFADSHPETTIASKWAGRTNQAREATDPTMGEATLRWAMGQAIGYSIHGNTAKYCKVLKTFNGFHWNKKTLGFHGIHGDYQAPLHNRSWSSHVTDFLLAWTLHGTLWDFELTRSWRSGGFEHSFFGITREPYWLSVACLRCCFRRYPPLESP